MHGFIVAVDSIGTGTSSYVVARREYFKYLKELVPATTTDTAGLYLRKANGVLKNDWSGKNGLCFGAKSGLSAYMREELSAGLQIYIGIGGTF